MRVLDVEVLVDGPNGPALRRGVAGRPIRDVVEGAQSRRLLMVDEETVVHPHALEVGPSLDGSILLSPLFECVQVDVVDAYAKTRRSWRRFGAWLEVDESNGKGRLEPQIPVGCNHPAGRRRPTSVGEDERPQVHELIVDEAAISS
jgi:hypothetical protein